MELNPVAVFVADPEFRRISMPENPEALKIQIIGRQLRTVHPGQAPVILDLASQAST